MICGRAYDSSDPATREDPCEVCLADLRKHREPRRSLIRTATYGLPGTLARVRAGKGAPEEWFPARRAPACQVVSTVGAVVLLGLARSHQAR